MCEYCKEDKRSKRKFIINSPILSIRIIHANELNAFEILSVNRANEIVKSYQIINYCPMCRKEIKRGRTRKMNDLFIDFILDEFINEMDTDKYYDKYENMSRDQLRYYFKGKFDESVKHESREEDER